MDEGRSGQIDPSSISLFATTASREAIFDAQEGTSHTTFVAVDQAGQKISYTKYANKKGKEVVARRAFIERLQRLKDTLGFHFNIPQFNVATMNQISMSVRKFSRSVDAKAFISPELLDRLFIDEAVVARQKIATKAMGDLLAQADKAEIGDSRYHLMQREDDSSTEEEINDFEEAGPFSGKTALSCELYDLLEQHSQLLRADSHAKRMLRELDKKQQWAETQLENMREEFLFEFPLETGDEEMDSLTCARCRPIKMKKDTGLPMRPKRELVLHNFDKRRLSNSSFRPIISHKRSGIEDYSFADESLHHLLSLPTSIPLDIQLQKYLHVISFISPEVELKRYKTAQILSQRRGKVSAVQRFYNLAEDSTEDEATASDARSRSKDLVHEEETRSIRLSLPFCKNGRGFGTMTALQLAKKRRRTMTIDNQQSKKFCGSKPGKIEGRRMSHAEFGVSMFDYTDAQLMDVGLPLPTIQKVENMEITVPSFRRRAAIFDSSDTLPKCDGCPHCQATKERGEDQHWTDIRRLHGELERQERQNRCVRPSAGVSGAAMARKLTVASFDENASNTSSCFDETG